MIDNNAHTPDHPAMPMLIRRVIHLVALLLIAISMQQPAAAQQKRDLESILNPDGTLDLGSGFSGSLDASGWTMMTDGSGRPVFTRAEKAARLTSSAGPDSFPGDQYWDEMFGPPGTNGSVYALLIDRGKLYVGGRFTVAGNAVADNIARWDGATWSALGDGVNGTVFALAVKGDNLIVGGSFTSVGATSITNIGQWNITRRQWSGIGFGVGTDRTVRAITVDGNDLYVGGDIDNPYMRSGAVATGHVAKWNGTYWSALGAGIRGPYFPGLLVSVTSIAVIGDDVYVGGGFRTIGALAVNGIARWNGTEWSALGSGVNAPVRSLLARNGELVAAGDFTMAGGAPAAHIAIWKPASSAWSAVGGGLPDSVRALAADSRYLYAGGQFTTAGGISVNYIARWNGAAWSTMLGGVADTLAPVINALAAVDDTLFAAGHFIIAGNVSAHNIARWDGALWYPLTRNYDPTIDRNGTSAAVYAVAVDGENVYVGGDFRKAGGVPANFIARWDGEEWNALGTGINGVQPYVRTIAIGENRNVYVGGIFSSAGSIPATGIARWDGSAWHAVGSGVGGTTPYVFSILAEPGGLIAGGAFTQAGGLPAARIARWNGTAWSALGSGIEGDSGEYVYVTALARFNGELYAGGSFARAGGARARNVAGWDGSAWTRLDSGANGLVSALASGNGKLFVGGEFTRAGSVEARGIAAWDGSAWTAIGGTTSNQTDGPIRGLVFADNALHAAGEFTRIGGVAASHVARWDGSRWRPVGRGVNAPAYALAWSDSVLYGGGDFTMADNRKANHVARWDDGLWSSLGSDPSSGVYGMIRAIAVDGDNIYVGGDFSSVGGVRANNVARWNGAYWSPLGRGRRNGVNGPVLAVEARDGDVYVGGMFTSAGNAPASYLARWKDEQWSDIGGVAGNNPFIFALALDGDNLYVGGAFAAAGGVAAQKIARWERTTRTWHALQGGVSGGGYYTYISSIAVDGGSVYAGGNFAVAGQVNANSIARWDGSAWHAMGGGVNNSVYKVIARGSDIYLCGDFTRVEGRTIAMFVTRWDGSRWVDMNGGTNQPVYDMALSNGEIYIGGMFTLAGQVQANGVARWDGRAWTTLGRGVGLNASTGIVYALAPSDSGVFVGGDFTSAGGKASYYFGRWQRRADLPSVVDRHSARPATSTPGVEIVPHPVRDHATLRLELPSSAMTTIELYDARGSRAGTLHSGWMESGSRTIELPADQLAAGLYHLVVTQGESVVSTNLVITR